MAVFANKPSEQDLVEEAVTWLARRLPEAWSVQLSSRLAGESVQGRTDAAIDLQAPGYVVTLAVEARLSLAPRDAETLLSGIGRALRALSPYPILVIAPWLSERTRGLLKDRGVNYLDLTGNARIAIDQPPLFIESQGADRDPFPSARGDVRLTGPRAARVIRLLTDVEPPYGVREIAEATQTNPGYVSQILSSLDREALVERTPRGAVVRTDVDGLLRRWCSSYDVLKWNQATSFLVPQGPNDALEQLASRDDLDRFAVTGSFAAVRLAPIATPALLMVYSANRNLFRELDALPTERGANAVILEPFDEVVWERTNIDRGVEYVAPPQVVADCLTGTGRMPAEGDALLAWMTRYESSWRGAGLDEAEAWWDDSGTR